MSGLVYDYYVHLLQKLNKNSLAVKIVQGQSEAAMLYKQPKTLISSKTKKLNILKILLLV